MENVIKDAIGFKRLQMLMALKGRLTFLEVLSAGIILITGVLPLLAAKAQAGRGSQVHAGWLSFLGNQLMLFGDYPTLLTARRGSRTGLRDGQKRTALRPPSEGWGEGEW